MSLPNRLSTADNHHGIQSDAVIYFCQFNFEEQKYRFSFILVQKKKSSFFLESSSLKNQLYTISHFFRSPAKLWKVMFSVMPVCLFVRGTPVNKFEQVLSHGHLYPAPSPSCCHMVPHSTPKICSNLLTWGSFWTCS